MVYISLSYKMSIGMLKFQQQEIYWMVGLGYQRNHFYGLHLSSRA